MARFKTRFKKLVAQASKQRRAEIQAQLAHEGQREDIEVCEEGNVLDGHTRYEILGDKVRATVVKNLKTLEEKEAYVIKRNGDSKTLTPTQEKDRVKKAKRIAKQLIEQGRTQQEVADMVGVDQATVSRWLGKNMQVHNRTTAPSPTGALRRTTDAQRDKVIELLKKGVHQKDIAAKVGLSRSVVSNIRKRAGIQARSKFLSEEKQSTIRNGVASNTSSQQIADDIGCAVTTVDGYIKKWKLSRPKQATGGVPEALCGRALHCRYLVADGMGLQAALNKCGLTSHTQATRVRKVAESGNSVLVKAVDSALLTPNLAASLVGKPDADIDAAIEEATAKKKAKELKATVSTGKGKTKADHIKTLVHLLGSTWLEWRGFRQHILANGNWIPTKGKQAGEIRHQLTTTLQVVTEVANTIRGIQGDTDVND